MINIMNKKILVLTMILSFTLNCIGAFANGDYSSVVARVNNDTRLVEINIALLQPKANVSITPILIIPNKTVADIASNPKVICYMATGKTDVTGKANFTYTLPSDAQSGYYTVSCGATGYMPAKQAQFYFSSQASIIAAKDDINAAILANDVAGIQAVISTYFKEIQIEEAFGIYNNSAFGINKAAVINAVLTHGIFANLSEVKMVFAEKVAVDAVNVAGVNEVVNTIVANNTQIGLDLAVYNAYTTVGDKEFFRRILKNKTYQTTAEIRATALEATMLISINKATWQSLSDLIIPNSTLINIPTATLTKYNSLQNKEKVMQEIKLFSNTNPFDGYLALSAEFVVAVDKQAKVEADAQAGGGGGGTTTNVSVNGGSYSGGIVPVQPQQNPNTVKVFSDIDNVLWAEESIKYLAERKIINGDGQGKFNPNDSVTREQFIKMLIIGFGLEDHSAEADFSDVSKNEWYYKFIASAKKLGITNGLGDGNFGIGVQITREELASMSYRAAMIAGKIKFDISSSSEFKDEKEIAEYAIESIRAMKNAGIVNGMEDSTFAPKANANRAQAAKIIYGLLKLQK